MRCGPAPNGDLGRVSAVEVPSKVPPFERISGLGHDSMRWWTVETPGEDQADSFGFFALDHERTLPFSTSMSPCASNRDVLRVRLGAAARASSMRRLS